MIHDTEESYDDTLATFENSHTYVSAHYVTRSADGYVTQMVPTHDVAGGRQLVDQHALRRDRERGLRARPVVLHEALYHSLARLTRYTAERYGIPLDREHIIGHDQVPGRRPTSRRDALGSGTYFDWAHFMTLVGAPITPQGADKTGRIVTIDPKFETNQPLVSECDGSAQTRCRLSPRTSSTCTPRRANPRRSSPTRSRRHGDDVRAELGRQGRDRPVAARRASDWLAIWYGGQKAWLYDPKGKNTVPAAARSSRRRRARVDPVYGARIRRACRRRRSATRSRPARRTSRKDLVDADYYSASTFNAPETYSVVKSDEQFYEISFNHRIAFVRATDVDTVS